MELVSCRVRETELQLPEGVLLLAMPESPEWGLQGWGMLSPEQGVGALSCRPGWKALASVTRGGMKEAVPGARAFENRGGRQGGPPRARALRQLGFCERDLAEMSPPPFLGLAGRDGWKKQLDCDTVGEAESGRDSQVGHSKGHSGKSEP